MGFVKRFALFWYDFVVGDDWLVAAGVVAMLFVSAIVAHGSYGGAAWLLTLLGVPLVVALSIWRVVRAT